jgi:hypothetical protein
VVYLRQQPHYVHRKKPQHSRVGSGIPRGEVWGGSNPTLPKFLSFDKADPNSQFLGKYSCNNLIRIRVSLICKLSRTPDPLNPLRSPSLCPLSSTEFVEPPLKKIPGYATEGRRLVGH